MEFFTEENCPKCREKGPYLSPGWYIKDKRWWVSHMQKSRV